MQGQKKDTINVFIAYAREDATYLQELKRHLRVLKRNGTLDKVWYDGEIIAGQQWEEEIQKEILGADIFLLLLSADFINSDYCYGREMEAALERHGKGDAVVIPIVVRECAWELTPLKKLQAPADGRAIPNDSYARNQIYTKIVRATALAADNKRKEKLVLSLFLEDKRTFEAALKLDTIVAYNSYLAQYPNGKFVNKANAHRQEKKSLEAKKLKEIEKTTLCKQEKDAWQKALNLGTFTGLNSYIEEYPNGSFVVKARAKIVNVRANIKQQAEQKELRTYEISKNENTIKSYNDYLAVYPRGKYCKSVNKSLIVLKRDKKNNILSYLQKIILIGVILVLIVLLMNWIGGIFNKTENTLGNDSIPTNFEEIFRAVEQMPHFPGCENISGSDATKRRCADKKMLDFIYANQKYPAIARENGLEGTCVVEFVVEKNGSLSDIKIVRDIGAGCGAESKRVVELMNIQGLKWIPGKNRGQIVRTQFNLPVKYRLE